MIISFFNLKSLVNWDIKNTVVSIARDVVVLGFYAFEIFAFLCWSSGGIMGKKKFRNGYHFISALQATALGEDLCRAIPF